MYQVLLGKEFCRNECTLLRETVDDGKIYPIFPDDIHIVINSLCTSDCVGAGIPNEDRRAPNFYKTLVCNAIPCYLLIQIRVQITPATVCL